MWQFHRLHRKTKHDIFWQNPLNINCSISCIQMQCDMEIRFIKTSVYWAISPLSVSMAASCQWHMVFGIILSYHFLELNPKYTGRPENCHYSLTYCVASSPVAVHKLCWVNKPLMSTMHSSNLPGRLYINALRLRRNEQHFADDISNVFSSMKMFKFQLKFHWSLFPRPSK